MYDRGNQLDGITIIDVLQAPGLLARASILVVAARGISYCNYRILQTLLS